MGHIQGEREHMGAGARLVRRGQRRARAMSVVGIALILCGLAQFLPASADVPPATLPQSQINRDINSYFLFALNKIDIKGGDETGPAVIPGNVGVNNPDTFNG